MVAVLEQRIDQVRRTGAGEAPIHCEKKSAPGAVSQRACVFCGSRVVLYPIVDALHLIHGPIGCAAYTWDIRGAQSTGRELHRLSFSTDLRERDVIHGGEEKLFRASKELIAMYRPRAAFVYSTCIVGLIGDDVEAVCRRLTEETGIDVLPVFGEGFAGTKKDGYRAACDALFRLVGSRDAAKTAAASEPLSLNILGDFNIAGEIEIIRAYYEAIGLKVVATVTGDGRVEEIRGMHRAALNVVQCSGSMSHLAKRLEEEYGQPSIRVSYVGIEDTAAALYAVAKHFERDDPGLMDRAAQLVRAETEAVLPELNTIRDRIRGKRAALYVGGAFKAFSLVKALRLLGMRTVLAGTQTGNAGDYDLLRAACDPGCIIVDDSNPLELCGFLKELGCDVFIGGVKERPIAFKLGLGFCDHNHERKLPLAGFVGMLNFAREVHNTVMSPVFDLVPRHSRAGGAAP
jgi:nitrogenase molybdenum-cofactor synthesis protein NifE